MIRLPGSALVFAFGWLALSATASAKTLNFKHAHVPNQVIVKFRDGVAAASAEATLRPLGGKVLHTFRSSGAQLVQFAPSEVSLLNRAESLAASPAVESVEANQIISISAVPNDPSFGELYAMNNTGSTGGTVDADIDAIEAWDISTGSRDVLVGIIDTGVDYTHPDIAPNYWRNPGETGLDAAGNDKSTNGIDDDNNGYIDDFRGWDFVNNDNDPIDDHNHGTHCAGTIGGNGNDGIGVVGVNWQVSMVGLKFLSGSGSGSLADAVKAIEYGTTLGVTLTSNSWGGGGYSDVMEAAIREANDKGILFIAAAGNSTSDNDRTPHYPSSYDVDNVIAVAATDHSDGIASFSSYGATTVDVGAPGVKILSSVKGGGYDKYDGTSMATPHVSGVAALVKAVFPEATAAQIKARILNTADPVASLQGKTLTGGRVNAYNALEIDNVAPNTATDLQIVGSTTTSVDLAFVGTGDDGDVGAARRYDVRIAANPILTDADFDAATRAAMITDAGTRSMTATVRGLAFNSSGYLAVKAVDNVGNVGGLSDTVAFTVRAVAKIAENDAESMDGATADAPWGLENVVARTSNAFSDSPTGNYADNAATSLTLDAIAIADSNITLVFQTAYDLEAGYDFGFVEVSGDDGTTWTQVDKLSGTAAWGQRSYDLTTILAGASSVKIRFRLTSDYSITKDGWKIDDVMLFAPAE